VKLDLVVVRGIDASPARQALVRAIVAIARPAGPLVVAEGVEDLEVARLGSDLEAGRWLLRSTERGLETERRPADEDPECQRTDEDLD
jgi:EAL domain-containing protein (putative c-di-GMP-specific phosphodiesterase class I)